jgi:transposase
MRRKVQQQNPERVIRVVHPVCCGIDVHKEDVKACLVYQDEHGQREQEVRTFGTMTDDILALRQWLLNHRCPIIALESTGVYWKPLFNLLEEDFEILLINPAQAKQLSGRKTDVRDCRFIAEYLEHDLLSGSYIPEQVIRDLRDLTRYRRRLVQQRTDEINRVHKILEMANIKLCSVATDIMGVSGRAILESLLGGSSTPEEMAELAKGRLRNKKPELARALKGKLRRQQHLVLAQILDHIDYLDEAIAKLEEEMDQVCAPFEQAVTNLSTIPGIKRCTAIDLIAETGAKMDAFPSEAHFCSWAGVCPGNNESAGKVKSGKTRKGNKWLRAIMTEAAKSAAKTKDTFLSEQYNRLARRKGASRAAFAVAHTILGIAYHILKDGTTYRELGADYHDKANKKRNQKYFIARLERMGLKVIVEDLPIAA